MPPAALWRLLSQAKVPLLMIVVVAMLVAFALLANDRRQCREACLKAGHAEYAYKRERLAGGICDCITRDGRTVAAPPPPR